MPGKKIHIFEQDKSPFDVDPIREYLAHESIYYPPAKRAEIKNFMSNSSVMRKDHQDSQVNYRNITSHYQSHIGDIAS
jgi:hypothetical protein